MLHLAKVIQEQNQCILCAAKFKTPECAQKHMIAKQHCGLNEEDFDQYEPFYDYAAENRRIAEKMQAKYGTDLTENAVVYRIEDDDDSDWVDESTPE